jgi:hypothetical protein
VRRLVGHLKAFQHCFYSFVVITVDLKVCPQKNGQATLFTVLLELNANCTRRLSKEKTLVVSRIQNFLFGSFELTSSCNNLTKRESRKPRWVTVFRYSHCCNKPVGFFTMFLQPHTKKETVWSRIILKRLYSLPL